MNILDGRTEVEQEAFKHCITTMHTGGGCMALTKELDNGYNALITDGDCGIPSTLSEQGCVLGIDNENGDWCTLLANATAQECIDMLGAMETTVSHILTAYRFDNDEVSEFLAGNTSGYEETVHRVYGIPAADHFTAQILKAIDAPASEVITHCED